MTGKKASTLASLGLGKAEIYEPEPEIPEVVENPHEPIIDESESIDMGFTTSASSLIEIMKLISLPSKSKNQMIFPNIALNFNNRRREVWWSNRQNNGHFYINFGDISYDYFEKCWGNGEVGLSIESLLKFMFVQDISKNDDFTFIVNNKTRCFELKNYNNAYTGRTMAISTIKNSWLKVAKESDADADANIIKLDKNYIPILKDNQLEYGADFMMSDVKLSLKNFNSPDFDEIILTENPQSLNIKYSYNNGQITCKVPCTSFCKPPPSDINILFGNLDTITNIDGLVSLRISENEKVPVYIKKEIAKNNGFLRTGVAISQVNRRL